MSRGFTSVIWAWDLEDEAKKIDSICAMGEILTVFALSPIAQKESVSDCVFCELFFPFTSAYNAILSAEVLIYAPLDFQASLSEILNILENLDESESECWNRNVVDGIGWAKIRTISIQALIQMEWDSLISYQEYLDSVRSAKASNIGWV
ncbi:hypothetical protein [Chamaesiphon sp.]|uniref:hypothetical protein n=1 Tax=Chamaesiphon sp. TaxID=2814140 RepID=UPI00359319F2